MTAVLDELKGLLREATPGEWVYAEDPEICFGWITDVDGVDDEGEPYRLIECRGGASKSRPNARLIAAMHRHLPALLAVARAAVAYRTTLSDEAWELFTEAVDALTTAKGARP